MITLFFSVDEKITQILSSHFSLIKSDVSNDLTNFQIYKKGKIILIQSNRDENSFRQAFLYGYSEFNPELFIFVGCAKKIGTEVFNGDVILPNVFFEYNKDLRKVEINENNRDLFLKDPIFIENYNIQNDYNFEDFGLRVGGIVVTDTEDKTTTDDIEKIKIAYEADVLDEFSYIFADESKKLTLLNKTYIVLGVDSKEEEISLSHISHIISFLMDNISEE